MPSSATPSRDLDERIRELQLKITQAPSIRKKIYQVQLAELIRQQQEQQQQQQQQQQEQQQQQQQQQQDNGGGKKYKKQSTKKRSTKKKQSTKKRSYKKRSKSIKRKAGGGRLPVFQQLAQGQGVSQDTDPDFWRRKGMIDRTSRERQRFQQETAWSGEYTDTE
jgi:Ca-activated chloride channel family protein